MTVATAERTTEQNIQYWGAQQDALGFESVWSIWECSDVNQSLLKKGKSYRVFYRFYSNDTTTAEIMNDTATMIEVSALTDGGTVLDLWKAAEQCWQKAKAKGDWHKYVENFEMQDDGSFELVMGS
jgi:putative lipase involved disintegration of autophagic bodies